MSGQQSSGAPWRIFRADEVDSTNERALEALARGDARESDVFIARAQSRGRGTRGRVWSSGPGGLYLSAVLGSGELPPPGLWTIAGALAVHDLCVAAGVRADLDWPNDLVSGSGAKIAGVLAESRGLRAEGPAVFVLGIGVNVRTPDHDSTLDDGRTVTSLRGLGAEIDLAAAEELLLGALAARVDQARRAPAALYGAFFERCLQAGQRVEVMVAGRPVIGLLRELHPVRGLRLEDENGAGRTVSLAHVRSMRCVDESSSGQDLVP